MKLYRINKLTTVEGDVVKKTDILANNVEQAVRAAAQSDDCPVCEVWSDGRKVSLIS